MQLKVKRGKILWLLPIKGEFTQKELQPYAAVMKKQGISVLNHGERVNVPLETFDKKGILAAFKQAAQQPRALDAAETCDCGEPFPENGYCKFCGARQRQRQ